MDFIDILHQELDKHHLLKHPFYKAWVTGDLSINDLQQYAEQYYHHVAAFPRYISAIHSECPNITERQILLSNLIEEEQGQENHPELWLRFAEGIGKTRESVLASKMQQVIATLVNGYFEMARSNFAKGLGALYAYERQTPAVAQSKSDGLQQFYGVKNPLILQFFTVHKEADIWHAEECAAIISRFNDSQKEQAMQGAITGAQLLWQFLGGMENQNSIIN